MIKLGRLDSMTSSVSAKLAGSDDFYSARTFQLFHFDQNNLLSAYKSSKYAPQRVGTLVA
jgi:hypothetical protein